MVSAVASGGGRELLPREAATPYPVSTTTDHLGALVMAPLNIAWILQAWLLLGATAYAVGPEYLVAAQAVVVAWLLSATALAQVAAWLWRRCADVGTGCGRCAGCSARRARCWAACTSPDA